MSKSQLNVYFEWNGIEIKAKKHKILQRYLKKDFTPVLINGQYKIEHFKDNYVIGIFLKSKNKFISFTRDTTDLPDILQSVYKYILCELDKDNLPVPVIANHTKAGKPRMYLIKGQDIYSGNLREHMRGFVMDKIKECYYPFIKDLKPIDIYPIKIRCEVHDTIKNNYAKNEKDEFGGRWDIDNLVYPYLKAFPDLLVRESILKDDDRLHLPSSIHADFVPIDNHEDRKLIFIIEKDERDVLKNNKLFCQFHKDSFESEDSLLIKDNEEIFDTVQRETFKLQFNEVPDAVFKTKEDYKDGTGLLEQINQLKKDKNETI